MWEINHHAFNVVLKVHESPYWFFIRILSGLFKEEFPVFSFVFWRKVTKVNQRCPTTRGLRALTWLLSCRFIIHKKQITTILWEENMQLKTRFIVIRNCRSVAPGLENSDVRPGSNSSIRVKKLECTAHKKLP